VSVRCDKKNNLAFIKEERKKKRKTLGGEGEGKKRTRPPKGAVGIQKKSGRVVCLYEEEEGPREHRRTTRCLHFKKDWASLLLYDRKKESKK